MLLSVSGGQGGYDFPERHDICILTWVAQAGKCIVDDASEYLLTIGAPLKAAHFMNSNLIKNDFDSLMRMKGVCMSIGVGSVIIT